MPSTDYGRSISCVGAVRPHCCEERDKPTCSNESVCLPLHSQLLLMPLMYITPLFSSKAQKLTTPARASNTGSCTASTCLDRFDNGAPCLRPATKPSCQPARVTSTSQQLLDAWRFPSRNRRLRGCSTIPGGSRPVAHCSATGAPVPALLRPAASEAVGGRAERLGRGCGAGASGAPGQALPTHCDTRLRQLFAHKHRCLGWNGRGLELLGGPSLS